MRKSCSRIRRFIFIFFAATGRLRRVPYRELYFSIVLYPAKIVRYFLQNFDKVNNEVALAQLNNWLSYIEKKDFEYAKSVFKVSSAYSNSKVGYLYTEKISRQFSGIR